MGENEKINLNSLYVTVSREVETELIQEINSNFYIDVSLFLDEIKTAEYDNGVEIKIKNTFIDISLDMILLLIKIRLDKSLKLHTTKNLLDIEQWILGSYHKFELNKDIITNAILHGRHKFIQLISNSFKTKLVVVRFLHNMDTIMGFDLNNYGPFKREDIATMPNKNAQVLIGKKIIELIHQN